MNLRNGTLQVGEEEIPLQKPAAVTTLTSCRAVLETTVILPPQSECVVPAKVDGQWKDKPIARWGIMEAGTRNKEAESALEGLLVARTLVDLHQPTTVVRMMNLTGQKRKVKKGTEIAGCEQVASVVLQQKEIAKAESEMLHLPEHLKELYMRSSHGLTKDQCQQTHNLLCKYAYLFSKGPQDVGRTGIIKHRIDTQGATPIRQPPHRLPLAKKDEAQQAIGDMRRQGIIEPSTSPWASPVVLVRKKDGGTRFCIDYRKLNANTRKDSYPLPRIDATLEALAGAEWFSSLDLLSGYWQVEMDEESKEKTAFSTGRGLCQFRVMPFGLCNAPATFERLMEQVLAGLPLSTCLVYLDDILVPGCTFEEQIHNLQQVFERLQSAGLKLSPKKCSLFRREVKYLGHVVKKQGVTMDPEKVQAVQEWPRPTNTTEVKRYLGLCSYYRRFIKGFADIAQPLHQCTEKMQPFNWTPEAEQAFLRLKQALTEAPVLGYSNPNDPFILDTDANSYGVGAVLSQIQDGQECVTAYYSQVLSQPERQYCTTRRELLAVVKAVKHFHPYVYGRSFSVRTDHAALRWLLSFRHPEGQMARWLERLQQYDFQIEHRPGIKHGNPDAPSRRPCLRDACKHCNRLESKEHHHRKVEEVPSEDKESLKVQMTTLELSTPVDLNGDFNEHSLNSKELRQAQQTDPDICPIVSWVEDGVRPPWATVAKGSEETKMYWAQWDSLHLKDGVVYRVWETPSGDQQVLQLLLPKTLRPRVLHELHNTTTGGHFGIAKTLGRVRERFYWCKCRRDVRDWCKACDLCASRKGPAKKIRAPMAQYNVGSPIERLAVDVMGPLPITESGNKYLLIAVDYFSKWPEAFPLPDQEAVAVAEVLVKEVVCRFGVPLYIHSDQGRNFESRVFTEMCSLLGISKTRTTPLHPQSDGMVERFNRTMEAQLSKFIEDHQRNWDQLVPLMLMAYRTAIHESTGCTPAKLMFARDLRLPIDLLYGHLEEELLEPKSAYATQLQEKLEQIHHFARDQLKLMSDRMKRHYDSHREGGKLEEGTPVWLYNPQRRKGVTPKLMRNWHGPYVVTKRINDLVYRVQLGPKSKPKVIHRNRLWQYSGQTPPTWFSQKEVLEPRSATDPSQQPQLEEAQGKSLPHSHMEDAQGMSLPQPQPEVAQPVPPPRRSGHPRNPPQRYGYAIEPIATEPMVEPPETCVFKRGTV